jgi:hypothetical protein
MIYTKVITLIRHGAAVLAAIIGVKIANALGASTLVSPEHIEGIVAWLEMSMTALGVFLFGLIYAWVEKLLKSLPFFSGGDDELPAEG